MNILYQDNHIFAVEKPVNLPVQADCSGDMDLLTLCKAHIKQSCGKPGAVYLGLLHRLDRPVGGVVVFARTSKAASRLSAQIRQGAWEKRYLAVVCRDLQTRQPQTLVDYLYKDEQTRNSSVVDPDAQGAKKAILQYTPVQCQNGLSLLRVDLQTGRHHQIRVQLAHAGLPIWGDARYHPAAKPGQQIALFAQSVTLQHPITQQPLTIACPMPDRLPFGTFHARL